MENDLELAPHIEDLKRALGDEFSKEKLIEELNKYFEYGIGLPEAKKAVIKKLGGDPNLMFRGIFRELSDIIPTDKNIELKVKVLSINDKTVNVQGSEKNIFYGLLADKTMVRPFTAWNDFKIQKDDVIHVRSAYAKDWRGEPQINFGNNTSIEHIKDSELEKINGSNITSSLPSSEFKIGTLKNGLSNITITGRVLSVEEKTVKVLNENKEIYTGKLGDESGKVAFTAWTDFKLKPGEVIKISGAYVRSWRGVPKLNFDDRMDLERLPNNSLPSLEELGTDKIIRIDKILEQGGGIDINIEGTLLDIKDGSGLIFRCPECNRVLRGTECMVHGSQDGIADLRVKAIIDDGTGAIMAVFNSEITSRLMGRTVEECTGEVKEHGPDRLVEIFEELNDILLMRPIRVKGTITTDEYGAMMICSDLDDLVLSEEVSTRIEKLLKNLNSTGPDPKEDVM
jgi:replication factor A1